MRRSCASRAEAGDLFESLASQYHRNPRGTSSPFHPEMLWPHPRFGRQGLSRGSLYHALPTSFWNACSPLQDDRGFVRIGGANRLVGALNVYLSCMLVCWRPCQRLQCCAKFLRPVGPRGAGGGYRVEICGLTSRTIVGLESRGDVMCALRFTLTQAGRMESSSMRTHAQRGAPANVPRPYFVL